MPKIDTRKNKRFALIMIAIGITMLSTVTMALFLIQRPSPIDIKDIIYDGDMVPIDVNSNIVVIDGNSFDGVGFHIESIIITDTSLTTEQREKIKDIIRKDFADRVYPVEVINR